MTKRTMPLIIGSQKIWKESNSLKIPTPKQMWLIFLSSQMALPLCVTFLVYHVESLDVPIRPSSRVYILCDQGKRLLLTGVVVTNGVPRITSMNCPVNVRIQPKLIVRRAAR